MYVPRTRFAVQIFCVMLATVVPARDAFEYAPLRRENVAEGDCIRPYPAPATPAPTFFFETFMKLSTPFYVPMGSQHLYRSYATYLLGRPPINQGELEAMNLRIRGSLRGWWRTMGYKNYFNQQCFFHGSLFRANCVAVRGSEGTNLDIIRQTTDTMVYTDNKSVFLIVRCVMGKENDWKLLSTKPEVDPEVKAKVLEKVMELGFRNSSYWAELHYPYS